MLLLWALLALGCLRCGWSKPGTKTPGCVQGGLRGVETLRRVGGTLGNLIWVGGMCVSRNRLLH